MKLLILTDDSEIKEVSFTKRRLLFVLTLGIFLGAGLIYLSLDAVTNSMYQVKLKHVKQNNGRLVTLLHGLQTRIDTLEVQLNGLQSQDHAIRTYADLPDVDKDILSLGIGGRRYDKTSELDFLMPGDTGDDVKVSGLLFDIDQVARMIKLERLNYEKLYAAFKNNSAEIEATPSIIPIDNGYFTDTFGWRRDPFNHQQRFHYGLDIAARKGTPVHVTADGQVLYAKRNGGFGLVIAVDHGYGYETLYGHLSVMDVRAGEKVIRGQKIGEVGNTGRSTAPHLHYEIHVDQLPQDPLNYFFSGYLE